MRKLHTRILSGACSPYEKTSSGILNRLVLFSIPVIQSETGVSSSDSVRLLELHQKNKREIKQLSRQLKIAFLQDISPDVFFDNQSPIQNVYAALSKLDKIQTVNYHYLKQNNLSGMQALTRSLNSVIVG